MDQDDNIPDMTSIFEDDNVVRHNLKWRPYPFMGSLILLFIKSSLTSHEVYKTFKIFLTQHAIEHCTSISEAMRSEFRIDNVFIMHCWEVFKGKTMLSMSSHLHHCPDYVLEDGSNEHREFQGDITDINQNVDVSYNDATAEKLAVLAERCDHIITTYNKIRLIRNQQKSKLWLQIAMMLLFLASLIPLTFIIYGVFELVQAV